MAREDLLHEGGAGAREADDEDRIGGGAALLLTNLLGIAIPRQLGRAVELIREASESSAPLADIESAGCLLAQVQYGDTVWPAGSVSLSV